MKKIICYLVVLLIFLTSFICKNKREWSVNIRCVSNMEDTCMIGKLIVVDIADTQAGIIPHDVSSFSYMLIRNDSVIEKGSVIGYIIPVKLQYEARIGDIAIYYNIKCDSIAIPENYSLTTVAPFHVRQ